MGWIAPVILLIGGMLVAGPVGAVIGLLFGIAVALMSARRSAATAGLTGHEMVTGVVGIGVLVGIGLVIWAIVAVIHGAYNLSHPQVLALQQAEARQLETQQAAIERAAKAEEAKKQSDEAARKARMSACMGPNAIDLPTAAFMELRRLCEQQTALGDDGLLRMPPPVTAEVAEPAEEARAARSIAAHGKN